MNYSAFRFIFTRRLPNQSSHVEHLILVPSRTTGCIHLVFGLSLTISPLSSTVAKARRNNCEGTENFPSLRQTSTVSLHPRDMDDLYIHYIGLDSSAMAPTSMPDVRRRPTYSDGHSVEIPRSFMTQERFLQHLP